MTRTLRRLTFVLLRREDFNGASRLLNRRDRGLRGAVNLNGQFRLDLAAAKQTDAALGATHHAGFHQRLGVDSRAGIDRAGIDRGLKPIEIDRGELDAEDVVEAALRQPPMQRHLAALEAVDAHTGARGLTLAATAAGLALAGADTPADPHALLARACVVG